MHKWDCAENCVNIHCFEDTRFTLVYYVIDAIFALQDAGKIIVHCTHVICCTGVPYLYYLGKLWCAKCILENLFVFLKFSICAMNSRLGDDRAPQDFFGTRISQKRSVIWSEVTFWVYGIIFWWLCIDDSSR